MIRVVADFKLRKEDEKHYIDAVKADMKANGRDIKNLQEVHLTLKDDGDVDVDYIAPEKGFERIRRINK